jgi:hypothetical protein
MEKVSQLISMVKKGDKPAVEELKNQMADQISTKIVDEIFNSAPGAPEAQAGADKVGQPPVDEKTTGPEGLRNVAPVPVSAAKKADVAAPSSEETSASSKGDSAEDPADPFWDLFPEDKVTEQVSSSNKEQEAKLREDIKGTAGQTVKAARSIGDVVEDISGTELFGDEKVVEAISLAQKELDAGLIDESELDNEAKRLFLKNPSELKGIAEMVSKAAAKKRFEHPDKDGDSLKTAMTIGSCVEDGSDVNLFE